MDTMIPYPVYINQTPREKPKPKLCPHCKKELPPEEDPSIRELVFGSIVFIIVAVHCFMFIGGFIDGADHVSRPWVERAPRKNYQKYIVSYPIGYFIGEWFNAETERRNGKHNEKIDFSVGSSESGHSCGSCMYFGGGGDFPDTRLKR